MDEFTYSDIILGLTHPWRVKQSAFDLESKFLSMRSVPSILCRVSTITMQSLGGRDYAYGAIREAHILRWKMCKANKLALVYPDRKLATGSAYLPI